MKFNKKKIIIISSVALSVIVIMLVLMWTLFGLKLNNVSLQVHQVYEPFSTTEFQEEVISQTTLTQHMSVFFINKTKVTKEIESKFPQVEVINIETIFPNGLKIHIAKRESIFALKNQANDNYIILDKDFKVLDIRENFVNSTGNEMLLENINYSDANVKLGDFISLDENGTILSNLAKAFLMSNRDATEQKSLIKSVAILTDEVRQYISNDEKVIKITLQDDFEIFIYSARTKVSEKVALMFSALPEAYPLYNETHYLEVYQKNDGSLFCKLSII